MSYSPPGKALPRLDAVLYVDKRGRVRMPPLNPYIALEFLPTPTAKAEKLNAQWLLVSSLLADDIMSRGLLGSVSLPPGFLDARSFQWCGFDVGIRYTFCGELPVDLTAADSSVRKRIRKGVENGYRAERSDDWASIMGCLAETEQKKGFTHRLSYESLLRASRAMGPDEFRGYIILDGRGTVVSGGVRLHRPGGVALDWIQGAKREHLAFGVNQLIYSYVLKDLAESGARAFDFGGANIAPVAAAKASWGLPLAPYVTIGARDLRYMVHAAQGSRSWLQRRLAAGKKTRPGSDDTH